MLRFLGSASCHPSLHDLPPIEQSGQGVTAWLASEWGQVGWGHVTQGMPLRLPTTPSAGPTLDTPSKGGTALDNRAEAGRQGCSMVRTL
jgi:hypothetical protein